MRLSQVRYNERKPEFWGTQMKKKNLVVRETSKAFKPLKHPSLPSKCSVSQILLVLWE